MNRRNRIESDARHGYGDWDVDRDRESHPYNWDPGERDRERGHQGGYGSGYQGDWDRDRWTNSPRGDYQRSYGPAGGGSFERDRDYSGRGEYERGFNHGYERGRREAEEALMRRRGSDRRR